MLKMTSRKRLIVPIVLGVFLAIGFQAFNSVRAKYASQEDQSSAAQRRALPDVLTCAKGTKILAVSINGEGRPEAVIEVKIENVSEVGIVAVAMEAITDGAMVYTVAKRSVLPGKQLVVLESHKSTNLQIPLSSIGATTYLSIGGVIYADGTEEGCGEAIRTLHELNEEDARKQKIKDAQ